MRFSSSESIASLASISSLMRTSFASIRSPICFGPGRDPARSHAQSANKGVLGNHASASTTPLLAHLLCNGMIR